MYVLAFALPEDKKKWHKQHIKLPFTYYKYLKKDPPLLKQREYIFFCLSEGRDRLLTTSDKNGSSFFFPPLAAELAVVSLGYRSEVLNGSLPCKGMLLHRLRPVDLQFL